MKPKLFKDRASWRWGDANRLAARHPLGMVPGLSWLFDPPFLPQSGHGTCVAGEIGTAFFRDWRPLAKQ